MNIGLAETPISIGLAALAVVLLVLAVIFLVLWLRARRNRRTESGDKLGAERERIDLELSHAEQAGKLRIAHESLGVSVQEVSAIISQADAARYASEEDPQAAVRTAASIADAARTTLADLRRIMDLVQVDDVGHHGQPDLLPTSELFDVMRSSGLGITFVETGEPFELKQGAELAIYRILQESLANSLLHGGEGTQVTVSYTWNEDSVQVLVDDDGLRAGIRRAGGDPDDRASQGEYSVGDDLTALTGVLEGRGVSDMRERAELFGGVFKAYPVPGVGFSVSVAFPALRYHNGIHGVNLDRGTE